MVAATLMTARFDLQLPCLPLYWRSGNSIRQYVESDGSGDSGYAGDYHSQAPSGHLAAVDGVWGDGAIRQEEPIQIRHRPLDAMLTAKFYRLKMV